MSASTSPPASPPPAASNPGLDSDNSVGDGDAATASPAAIAPATATGRLRRGLVTAFKWLVTVGTLAYLYFSGKLDVSQIRVAPGDWGWVAVAAVLIWTVYVLGLVRFVIMMRGAGIRLPWGTSFRVGMIGGYFNLIGPGGIGGDVVRTGYAMAASGRRSAALAAALMDRYAGLLGLSLVGAAAVAIQWRSFRYIPEMRMVGLFLFGLCLGMTVALAVAAWRGRAAHDWLSRRGFPGARLLCGLMDSLLAYRAGWRELGIGVVLSAAFHLLLAVAVYFLSLGLTALSAPALPLQVMVATPITFLANTLPMPGGGLGVGEAVFDKLLRWLPSADGTVITGGAALFLAYRLLVIPFSLAGLPFYLRGRHIVEEGRRTYAAAE